MADPTKVIKGGLNAVRNASRAADQILEAKRLALEAANPPIKASEAYGQHEGAYMKPIFYDRMKVDLTEGKLGGPGFSGIQLVDPDYAKAKAVAGVTDQKMATRILNRNKADVPAGAKVIWTPSVGGLEQHKSNSTMFGQFADIFASQRKNMSAEEIQKLSDRASNAVDNKGVLIFPNGIDLGSNRFRQKVNTYNQRALMADIFAGRGVGGEKGRTVPVEELLEKNLDPNVASAGTLDLGNRLFRLEGDVIDRPDLHSDYRKILTGEDLNVNYIPVPIRDVYSDWEVQKALDLAAQGKNRPVTLMDYTKNDPTVQLTDALLTKMQKAGQKKGGVVRSEESPEDMDKFHKCFKMHKAFGGAVVKKADGGKIAKGMMGAIEKASKMADDAMAASRVLPVAERDANLAKYLDKSKVKNRAYHATDQDVKSFDPKSDKRTENKSNIAGWMTNDPEFANDFAAQKFRHWKTSHRPWEEDPNVPPGANIMPVHLSIENPFYATDLIKNLSGELNMDEANAVAKALGVRVDDLIGDIPKVIKYKASNYEREHTPRGFDLVKSDVATDAMRRLGYDGVIATENGSEVYAPFNSTQIKSATGNRGTYDLNDPDINKARGGVVHMVDGGKLAKGITGALTKASTAVDAAMAEANLKKMLEPSKVQQRLYHGTTATEGGKGQEAIRRIKPSKEGALGSGVYLTPKADFAGSYAEEIGGNVLPVHAQIRNPLILRGASEPDKYKDPMIEALELLGMDTKKASYMVEKAYEDRGYIGKQVQSRAQAQGYDGIMQYDRDGNLSEVVSYNPNAVKSATGNQGTYDITHPDLSKAKGGAIRKESPEEMKRFSDRFAFHKANGKRSASPQKFDGGGIASPEESLTPPYEGDRTKAGLMAELLAKMAKEQGKEEIGSLKKPRAATDLLNRGVLANNPLSAGIDLINMGLVPLDVLGSKLTGRDIKVSSDKPFLGSEYVKDLMNQYGVTSGEERPMMETALSFASPTAMIKGAMKATDAAKKAPELIKKATDAFTSSKLPPLATEAKTASAGKPTGATYATKQDGPFFRVSPTALDTSKAKSRGIREGDELQGSTPLGGSAESTGRETPQFLSSEEVGRIIADPVANEPLNIAKKYTQETQGVDFGVPNIPESTLAKQSAIGRTQQLAVDASPEYKTAVFDAYAKQMPDVLEQAGAKNYDDLMEKAYRQMAKETDDQFRVLPYNFSYHRAGEGNYNGAMDMASDVHGNKHLYVYQGGDKHDFLNRIDPASGLNENEKFRAVHDLLGHAIYGNQFGPKGEEMAWAVHSQMYSPLARLAMTAETRGQNSMVNYSPLNAELKAQLAKYDDMAVEARRKGDKALLNKISAAKRQAYSGFEFAPNKAVLLPPEFLSTQYAGGMPAYLEAANRPVKGTETQSVLTHFSNDPNLRATDPGRYGTGIKGAEAERLRDYPGAVRDRSYFYMGEPGTVAPEPGLGVNRYRGEASSLYDITQDPLNFQKLARESNRTPFAAKYNQGITHPLQDANDIERLVKEYGYQGMANPKASKPMAIMFKETPVRRQARGGLTLMK